MINLYLEDIMNNHKVCSAFGFASIMHQGQTRKFTFEPYINHPIDVANILIGYGYDEDCICAALLHDVIEDTEATEDDIRKMFGGEILFLVKGMTKTYEDGCSNKFKTESEINRFKYIIDQRIHTIKLADILANLSDYKTASKGFMIGYVKGKKALLPFLVNGNKGLFDDVTNLIGEIEEYLKV